MATKFKEIEFSDLLSLSGIAPELAVVRADGSLITQRSFDIEPQTQLRYAREALERNTLESIMSAQSCAKRAIDGSLDKVLGSLGIEIPRGSFYNKAKLIKELGIRVPQIVLDVIDDRNNTEHDYASPSRKEVENAVDIAELFIPTPLTCLNACPNGLHISNNEEGEGDANSVHVKNMMNGRYWQAKFCDKINDIIYLAKVPTDLPSHLLLGKLVMSVGRADQNEIPLLVEIFNPSASKNEGTLGTESEQ